MNILLRLLLVFFVLMTYDVFGQAGQNAFGLFAEKQDSLFLRAYESRDVHQYEQLMLEFLSRYDSLQPEDQKNFTGYLNGAYYNLACTAWSQEITVKAIIGWSLTLRCKVRLTNWEVGRLPSIQIPVMTML